VKLIISWHFFFSSLRRQAPAEREDWVMAFEFDDRGVALQADSDISLEQVLRCALAPQPAREEHELRILAELTERKRARLVATA
jgi:hypothetical protein